MDIGVDVCVDCGAAAGRAIPGQRAAKRYRCAACEERFADPPRRRCLKCRRDFESRHRFNRLCQPCRTLNAAHARVIEAQQW